MAFRISILAGVMALAGAASIGMAQTSGAAEAPPADDPHVWLEEVQGERAVAWARTESERTLNAFQSDPRYQGFYDRALDALQARDRIPFVQMRPDGLYNFWQDQTNVRGLLRRTSMESYRTETPEWETVLDIDALARDEGKSWVYQGMQCLPPEQRRCLVQLSEGGRDASVLREFDIVERRFVEGGFNLTEAKQSAAWVDADTLLVSRDWGEGTLTSSGYPFVVKRLRRGQPIEQAEEVFRGAATDVGVFPFVLRDAAGAVHGIGTINYVTTFENEVTMLTPEGPVRLPLPRKSNLVGIVDGRLIAALQEPWAPADGLRFETDSVISYDLAEWKNDPVNARPSLVWAPAERQTLGGTAATRDQLLLSVLDNVRGRALALDYENGEWRTRAIELPQNATIGISAASDENAQAMFTVTDYLSPTTLWFYDGASGSVETLKSTPARFDASGHVVEQLEATSRDGTRIPYFLIRPRNMRNDGSTPTLLNGYGGFQSAQVPAYSSTLGRLWLEQGNAYVVANLRGGGEFGPGWHQSAQLANKQRTWDDFIAVAEDLIRRNVTSPRRLGVIGGSQGGLLVGTAITQRPELFNAAIVQVPLFDMLRYHLIGAGASWIGEYGDPRIPEQRAWLEAYSPYQKLRRGVTYPMPFIHSSTADDRVTPVHGRKAAARLAEFGQPYYYYENMEGGHAAAANLPETARRLAMEYIYATQRLVD
jgi:prolyl oligopeptidase